MIPLRTLNASYKLLKMCVAFLAGKTSKTKSLVLRMVFPDSQKIYYIGNRTGGICLASYYVWPGQKVEIISPLLSRSGTIQKD